jgi:hypothetical protein
MVCTTPVVSALSAGWHAPGASVDAVAASSVASDLRPFYLQILTSASVERRSAVDGRTSRRRFKAVGALHGAGHAKWSTRRASAQTASIMRINHR